MSGSLKVLAFVLCFLAALSCAAADHPPNFVVVLTDDQGWIDTSVPMLHSREDSASPFLRTPQLERLAARGVVFSNAYSPAPTCTPSRASFQFGKSPARLRQTVVHDVLASERGIDLRDEASFAHMIKSNDSRYVAAHFGKWGFPPLSPDDAGYDVSDGNTNNGDGDFLEVKTREPLPASDPKRMFSVTDRANEFIAEQAKAGRPFFLQLSHYGVHVDHQARPGTMERLRSRDAAGRFTNKDLQDNTVSGNNSGLKYAAMVEDLDESLGLLLDQLAASGVQDNTYIFFTSDNGGGFRGNGPLKGGKAQVWEGGLRVPLVIAGPEVEPGRWCDEPVAGWDLWATIHDLSSNDAPPDDIDGVSLQPLFRQGDVGHDRFRSRSLVFHFPWYAGHPMTAIRRGDFKLIRSLNTHEFRLFDLSQDLGERKDLAAGNPMLANELNDELTAYLSAVDAETIRDMRAARRRELHRYIERDESEIAETRERLQAADAADQPQLERQLRQLEQRIALHHAGLKQVEDSETLAEW